MSDSLLTRMAGVTALALATLGVAIADAAPGSGLPQGEMNATRGRNPGRGTHTATCNQYQAIKGVSGVWSCAGMPNGTGCKNCETTSEITHADQGGAHPRNMTDGEPQDCGRVSAPEGSTVCVDQICTGNMWSNANCIDPGTPKNQTP